MSINNDKKTIPVAGPSISKKEIAYVTDAIRNGWYEHANDYILSFEKAFAQYLGRKYAISLPSCTSALHLSLLALDIKQGDEVIVPDATWIASAAPVSYVGATPVFADIDPQTWCLSAETIQVCITPKTKAIIVVNLYGHMPEWNAILKLAKKHNIAVIEDAAESIGSQYQDKLSGTFGITSCFSFHGSKTLTTGEGGMLVTDDEHIYKRCAQLRDHGRAPGDIMFQNLEVGYKYKMSPLQAALGLAQLERVEELVQKKRQIFGWYQKYLKNIKQLTLNPHSETTYNSYWMSTLVWDKNLPLDKPSVVRALAERNIASRPFFDPLSSLPAYAHLPDIARYKKQNLHSYDIAARAINLPSALCLKQTEVKQVAEALREIIV